MIITPSDLADIRAKHKHKKLVLTSGTFDLFHVGHLRYLEAVRKYGDVVVVLLSGDSRVRGRKGEQRPIIPEDDRAQVINSMKGVDYVLIDPVSYKPDVVDPLYADIIARLQPDVYVTDGEDVRFSGLLKPEQQIILPRATGGAHGSTTAIINHIATVTHDR